MKSGQRVSNVGLQLSVVFGYAVEDGEDLVEGGGVDHWDAELLEVAEAFEVAAVVLAHLEHYWGRPWPGS